MVKLKITKLGNAFALLLRKKALIKLRLEQGDTFRLTPHDLKFERQMMLARKVMKKHRWTLRRLAK